MSIAITLTSDPEDSIVPGAAGMYGATIQVKSSAKLWWGSDPVTAPAQGIDVAANTIFHLKQRALSSFRATGSGVMVVMPDAEEDSAYFF